MTRTIGGFLRIAAVVFAAGLAAACNPANRAPLGPPAMGISQMQQLGAAPVRGPEVTFAFLTLTNVPGQVRFDMEDSLKKYAATRNLKISVRDSGTATYRIKGYLSALGDQNGTLLVYTWDVHDTAGRPLHRISGQQVGDGSRVDPWQGIKRRQIDDAARDTIDGLADWVRN